MKALIIMLTLTTALSFTANANEMATDVTLSPIRLILAPFVISTTGGMTTSGKECEVIVPCKEAGQIVEDTQNYLQSGELTVYLSQKIKDVQSTDESLSEVEALEVLVTKSVEILK